MNKRKGISLIVLVITILVMIILAGVAIVSLTDNNPIKQANSATEKTNYATYASELEMKHVKMLARNDDYDKKSITTEDPEEIKDYVDSITKADAKKYAIVQGKLWLKDDIVAGKPVLLEGMTPVKWNGTAEVETTENDPEWYNYDAKKWPNAKTEDGSYFVWIPRYEYKITYNNASDKSQGGKIDINIIKIMQKTPTAEYKIHPAFTDGTANNFANGEWDMELPGMWIAKYDAAKNSVTGKVESKPGVAQWGAIRIGDAYINALAFDTAKESHMLKNSEWGAVAYFTHSKYGRNGEEVKQNTSDSTANGDPHANVEMSSTKNITGIYDLSGSAEEYVAAYVPNNEEKQQAYGQVFTASKMSSKYATVYPLGVTDTMEENYATLEGLYNKGLRYGDAIVETSRTSNNSDRCTSFFGDESRMAYTDDPYLKRGGNRDVSINPNSAGIFSFRLASGGSNAYAGFRIALCGK